jgi:hypothetical protein
MQKCGAAKYPQVILRARVLSDQAKIERRGCRIRGAYKGDWSVSLAGATADTVLSDSFLGCGISSGAGLCSCGLRGFATIDERIACERDH